MNDDTKYNMLTEELISAFRRFHRRDTGSITGGTDHRMNESRTLLLLQKSGPEGMNVSALSKHLQVTSPFVTQLVNRLEGIKLILKKKDPKDRRAVRIVLTEKGRKAASKIQKNYREVFAGLVTYLGEEDSKQLATLLHKTFDYLENHHNKTSQGGKSE